MSLSIILCGTNQLTTRAHTLSSPTSNTTYSTTAQVTEPELPRAFIDTSMPAASGRVISVRAGDSVQEAVKAAQPGDVVEIEAGASFIGLVELPAKEGEGWVTIRSSRHAELPEGVRVSPAQSHLMPKLLAPGANDPVIRAQTGAHHYRLIGLEIALRAPDTNAQTLVTFGDGSALSRSDFAHHLILDRSYVHGSGVSDTVRGVAMNANYAAVINSYISEIHAGADSQAVCAWTGDGPFLIENNHLEAAGENIMFGGSDPRFEGLVPSDITIRRNNITKTFRWRAGHPEYDGSTWAVKNLIEIKNGRRILIEGNTIENSWEANQQGAGLMLKATVQEGRATWTVCEDVTVRSNIIRRVGTAFVITSYLSDYLKTNRILIENNLIYEIDARLYGGAGNLVGTPLSASDVIIRANTVIGSTGVTIRTYDSASTVRFSNLSITNNLFQMGWIGLSSTVEGAQALEATFPGTWTLAGNVWFDSATIDYSSPGYPATRTELDVAGRARFYPDDTLIRSNAEVGFVDFAGGNYRLRADSPVYGRGVDFTRLDASLGGSFEPTPSTTPPPTPTPSATPTPTPTPPPSTTPADGWARCANEGGRCAFSGTRQVRYGAGGAYAYGTFADGVDCNNWTFGDPAEGTPKTCEVRDDAAPAPSPSPTPTPVVQPPPPSPAGSHSLRLRAATGDYFEVPDAESLDITGALTLEAWIKVDNPYSQQGIIERYNSFSSDSSDGGYALRLNSAGKLQFYTLQNGYIGDGVTGGTSLTAGVWHHVAGVFDGTELRVYVNGRLDAAKQSTFAPTQGTASLKVGARGDDGSFTLDGLIDEVRVTAQALYATDFTPDTQLTALWEARALWRFDGETSADSSAKYNHGLLRRSAAFSSDVPNGSAQASSSSSIWGGSFAINPASQISISFAQARLFERKRTPESCERAIRACLNCANARYLLARSTVYAAGSIGTRWS